MRVSLHFLIAQTPQILYDETRAFLAIADMSLQ